MPLTESLVTKVISEILKQTIPKGWRKLSREARVLQVLRSLHLQPGKPDPTFESVYAHAIVEFGVEQPEVVLKFFDNDTIRNAFERSWRKKDFAILTQEAAAFLDWSRIGDELRAEKIDPRLEFARFQVFFNVMVDRTRTPAEVRRELKLDEILGILKHWPIDQIRTINIAMAQPSDVEFLKAWFKTLGYGLDESHEKTDDGLWEGIVNIPARRGFDRILVRYLKRQAEGQDLIALEGNLERHAAVEGWIIAAQRKAISACELAGQSKKIFCYTFDELFDQHADFTRYFDWLEEYVTKGRIHTDYIPLTCRRELYNEISGEKTGEERYAGPDWIEGYIDRWLEDPCKEHVSILGEFGTGKTWFAHHLAFREMRKYKEAKAKGLKRPRVPLVIHLRDYAKALNSQTLFSDFFFRRHEMRGLNYSCFELLNRMGKLLLIFDGFDEMADKLDRQKMIDNFWELARVVVPGAKAILTCRTEHFPTAREGRQLLNAELKASTSNLTGDPPQFEVLHLELFDPDQIRQALGKRTDPATVERIMRHPELLDLAKRPVMLDFILEALPDITSGKPVDLSRIYLYAVCTKMERDIAAERTFTCLADKLFFLCEVTWEMLKTAELSLNYRLFPERLKSLFGPVVAEEKDLDHWRFDMMGNSLLTRNDDGDYFAPHKSLVEFFATWRLLAMLGVLPEDFTAPARRRSASDIDPDLPAIAYTWSTYFRRTTERDGVVVRIASLDRFCAENPQDVLRDLANQGDAVWRMVYEITNVPESRGPFLSILTEAWDGFCYGSLDPQKDQPLARFLAAYRALCQTWEAEAGAEESVRRFWAGRLEAETGRVKDRARPVKLELNLAGQEIELPMVEVGPGSFLMGDEKEGPIHRVKISRSFHIGVFPVGQRLYQAVMGKNPSRFKGDDRPVETVSWLEAVNFCNRLSERMGLDRVYDIDGEKVGWRRDADGMRLPTEAEWEYACRAGTCSRYAGGDLETDLNQMGWYEKNSQGKTQPMGRKRPNAWGLYDMHGNVWEWVWDWYDDPYPGQERTDPCGPKSGSLRVLRGGGWNIGARGCRSVVRNGDGPDDRYGLLGFRLSRSVALGP